MGGGLGEARLWEAREQVDEDRLHRALVERSDDLVVVLDADAHVVWASSRLPEVLGYEVDRVTGQPALELVHPDDVEVAGKVLAAAMDGNVPEDPMVVRVRRADGWWSWLEVVGGDLGDDPAIGPARHALYLRDVTHRTEREEATRLEREAVQAELRRNEERFRALVLHANDSIVVVGVDGKIEQANPDRGLFGPRPADQVLGTDAFSFVHDDDRERVESHFADLLALPGETITSTFRVEDRDGQWRWIEATATNMIDHDAVRGIVVNYRDITERVEAQQQAERLAQVLEATEALVGIATPDGRVLHLNRAARAFAGLGDDLSEATIPGAWVPPSEWERLLTEVLGALDRHGSWAGELRLVDEDGREVPMLAQMTAHRGPDGQLEHFSWILRDIAERIAREEHLAHRATHDPLTGLPNRSHLVERLTAAIEAGEGVAALFVDLDDFKALNDRRGHAVGDVLLKEIADRIQGALRPQDLVARYGGDEFVAVVEGVTTEAQVTEVADRILAALVEPLGIDQGGVVVGASIGVATALGPHQRAVDAAQLLSEADGAMYRAKAEGRGQVAVHRADR